MAEVRLTASELGAGRINRPKTTATTQADIRGHMIEDGEDPDVVHDDWYPSPASVRRKLGLSQVELAEQLQLPVATWRNWEQERVEIDPAVRALLRVFWRIPHTAMRSLRGCPVCLREDAAREPSAAGGEIIECQACGALHESRGQTGVTSVQLAKPGDRRRA